MSLVIPVAVAGRLAVVVMVEMLMVVMAVLNSFVVMDFAGMLRSLVAGLQRPLFHVVVHQRYFIGWKLRIGAATLVGAAAARSGDHRLSVHRGWRLDVHGQRWDGAAGALLGEGVDSRRRRGATAGAKHFSQCLAPATATPGLGSEDRLDSIHVLRAEAGRSRSRKGGLGQGGSG